MRRIPLWLTAVPLVIGGVWYWHFWSGYRDRLRADIVAVVPGATTTIGGFPYRMEADVAAPVVTRSGAIKLVVRASRALVNRGPWQPVLTVIRSDHPSVDVRIPALTGVTARLDAATGVSSLHLAGTTIARQSNVFTAARLTTGLFAASVSAASFEVHFRETRARSNEAWSPTPPQQAQVVLTGTGVRFGNGAPLMVNGNFAVTATTRLRDFAAWADGGTVEVRALTLTDASGEVARLVASAVPIGGTLRLTGTIFTVCPASFAAAANGTATTGESRRRSPVRLTFGGTPGAFKLGPLPSDAPQAVRSQLPPCPRLN